MVGLGASAGGLTAFERFFSGIPAEDQARLAIVVVQHLDPVHESMLRSLLQQHTEMHVSAAVEGMRLEPGCVYTIPPNRDLTVSRGILHTDPPFSHIDLISCRNLLIYLSPELQRRVLPIFHYALVPHGYLFLGTSERIGAHNDLFEPVDRKSKLFIRHSPVTSQRAAVDFVRPAPHRETTGQRVSTDDRQFEKIDVRRLAERYLLIHPTPAAVVVTQKGEAAFIHGRTGEYLEPASAEASLNINRPVGGTTRR